MCKTKYSFIIPHHNSPELLDRCLSSIPVRSDVEIIVVDDKSSDDKKPVIRRFDTKIIYINETESKGAGKARNVGLKNATGEWVLFADCDDFYEKGFLDVLDYYSTCDIEMLCFDVYYAYDLDCRIEKWPNRYSNAINTYMERPNKRNLTVVKHIIQGPWNFMVKREIPIIHNVEFEELPRGNDAFFHHKISMICNKVAVSNKKLYYWVWTSNGITHKHMSKMEFNKSISQSLSFVKRITELKINAGAWSTIVSFRSGFISLVSNYGLCCATNYKVRLLFCGIPWIKIWFYKLLKF